MNSELVLSLVTYKLLLHDLKADSVFRSLKGEDNILSRMTPDEINGMIDLLNEKYQKMEILSSYDKMESDLIKLSEQYKYAGWMLKKNLSIYRARSTDFVEITFISENPFLSAFVVNSLGEEYIRFDSYLKSGISKESLIFFSELVEEKRKILEEKTKFVDKFKLTNNPYGDLSELKSAQVVDYEILRQQKLDEIRSKNLALVDINEQLKDLEGEEGSVPSNTNITILQIRTKINELNQLYVGGGSTDKQLLNTILNLRNQLQVEMNKLTSSSSSSRLTKGELEAKKRQLELELNIFTTNLASLEQLINNLKNNISGITSSKSELDALNREVENASDEYLQAVDRYNVERNKSLLSKSQVAIYQKGQPNGAPEPSKKILIIGLAFMASLSLCVFSIVFIELIDQRLKNPSKFETITGLKLLGFINEVAVKNLNLKALYEAKTENGSMEKFKHFLRKIRFEIENSGGQVVLVTSTKVGEGKTFFILSLAYSLSLLNKRSLIIDTNFRNNSLTNLLYARPNFQKMLQQDNDLKLLEMGKQTDEKPQSIISKTSDRNIDIIGSHQVLESPSEVLAGKDFKAMIDQFSKSYDYIFLEGAALNEFSDTKELVTFVDKVLLIFSANSLIKKDDKDSIQSIKNINGKYLGAILNKVANIELT
jgi:polysaccharide biosynthesis transport protein